MDPSCESRTRYSIETLGRISCQDSNYSTMHFVPSTGVDTTVIPFYGDSALSDKRSYAYVGKTRIIERIQRVCEHTENPFLFTCLHVRSPIGRKSTKHVALNTFLLVS